MSPIRKPSDIGIVVAADLPERYWPEIEQRLVEPVALRWVYRKTRKEPFEVPVRDLLPEEVVMVVNKGLVEGKIEFGFRVREGPPLPPSALRLHIGGNA
jgi:hypothetical protein